MQIQILGLRTYTNAEGKERLSEKFFDRGWRADSVASLFANLDEHLAKIPKEEHYNLFYTVSKCLEEKGRKLAEQSVIPFDLDGIDPNISEDLLDKLIAVTTKTLKVSRKQIGITMSGHGLQFLVQGSTLISDLTDFDAQRVAYKAVIGDLNSALWNAGLDGNFDVSVWSPARLMRLPGTVNDKRYKDPKLVPVPCYAIETNIDELDFTLDKAAALPEIPTHEHLKKYRTPDTEGVETCEYLRYCKENQDEVTEAQWYAMLSIVGRLENGPEEAHAYSQDHKDYTEYDTNRKLQQALDASGPRTCKNIQGLWDGCVQCEHYDKVTSPITLQGPNYIKTRDTGFYNIKTNAETGDVKRTTPNFRDLMKYYGTKRPGFFTVRTGNDAMFYDDEVKYWIDTDDAEMETFAQGNFQPDGGDYPPNAVSEGFRKHLRKEVNFQRNMGWMNSASEKKMNMQNGVLDLTTMELLPHAMKHGFSTILPYAYDPDAKCERFDTFMDEITKYDNELKQVLLEYVAYAMSGMNCKLGKALILVGDGANGKSTFTNVVKVIMGEQSYANVGLADLGAEGHRIGLKGRLASFGDEVPANAFNKGKNGVGEIFKCAVTGGELSGRELYSKPVHFHNKAKFFLSCNELPHVNDHSNGLFRRMLIAPFDAVFNKGDADPDLDEKLEGEAPGVLNRVLEAYRALEARGDFIEVQAVDKALNDYREGEDMILAWFRDSVEITESFDDKISCVELFQSYLSYCEAENAKFDMQIKQSAFSRRLTKIHPFGSQYRVKGLNTRVRGFSKLQLIDVANF